MRSVSPKKGKGSSMIDNVAFFEYTKLPGIVNDRFWSTFKHTDDAFVAQLDFVTGFTKVYLSTTDEKMKMTFDM